MLYFEFLNRYFKLRLFKSALNFIYNIFILIIFLNFMNIDFEK